MASQFAELVDSFNASEAALMADGIDRLYRLVIDEEWAQLRTWKLRPNGAAVVGRSRRVFEGLISVDLELKSIGDTDCSSASTALQHLNFIQLLTIKWLHRTSVWARHPRQAHQNFAIRLDNCLHEALVQRLFAVGATLFGATAVQSVRDGDLQSPSSPVTSPGSSARDAVDLDPAEIQYIALQTERILGSFSHLRSEKAQEELTSPSPPAPEPEPEPPEEEKEEDDDDEEGDSDAPRNTAVTNPPPLAVLAKESWWYTPSVAPGTVGVKPRPVYLKVPECAATFVAPRNADVYRLAVARNVGSFGNWSVTAWRP